MDDFDIGYSVFGSIVDFPPNKNPNHCQEDLSSFQLIRNLYGVSPRIPCCSITTSIPTVVAPGREFQNAFSSGVMIRPGITTRCYWPSCLKESSPRQNWTSTAACGRDPKMRVAISEFSNVDVLPDLDVDMRRYCSLQWLKPIYWF